jgi:hypothetical protein
MPSTTGHGWWWQHNRYDVLNTEKVDGRDCFVLQEKFGDTTIAREGIRFLCYVRTDDYRIVRQVEYFRQAGKLVGPSIYNFPEGVFGPGYLGQQLPQFPLDTAAVQDSTFRLRGSGIGGANLRQFSGPADSALLNRYLSDPGPSSDRPVQPRGGKMFSVLSEPGAPREPGGPLVPYDYSLQLWSTDYPWRLYEEQGQYAREGGARQFHSRSWLIACGRAER